MFVRKYLTMAALSSLAAVSAFAQTTTTPATATRALDLPPFGLGATETARVNLTNIATASTGGTAASCTGSVSFLNSAGAAIGAATTFTIASGVTSSVSLPFSSAGISGTRGEVRAVVSVTRTSGTPCSLLTSLQTFDTSSGATHLYLSSGDGGFGLEGGPGPGR